MDCCEKYFSKETTLPSSEDVYSDHRIRRSPWFYDGNRGFFIRTRFRSYNFRTSFIVGGSRELFLVILRPAISTIRRWKYSVENILTQLNCAENRLKYAGNTYACKDDNGGIKNFGNRASSSDSQNEVAKPYKVNKLNPSSQNYWLLR